MSSLFHDELVESNRIIYTPSDFAKSSLFHLQETGSLQAKFVHTCSRTNLSSYLFFIVESGSGTLCYDNISYSLFQNDCIFIDCRKPYAHSTSNHLWKLKWVHFYGPNMNMIYQKYLSRGGTSCFKSANLNLYLEALEQIYTIAISDSYVKDMKIHEKLSSLLVLLMEDAWNPQRAESSSEKILDIQKIKEYIDENYIQKISLDNLSEKFFINKYYLLRLFKERYGFTVNDYIIRLRITKSKQLLRFSEMTVEKISYECGINSPNYFARLFKKIEGISPAEYRKLWKAGENI